MMVYSMRYSENFKKTLFVNSADIYRVAQTPEILCRDGFCCDGGVSVRIFCGWRHLYQFSENQPVWQLLQADNNTVDFAG